MKIIRLIFLITLFACNNEMTQSNVTINQEKDTINVNEVFTAKLSVPFNDSILPAFYIIFQSDTLPMPFYEENRFAEFNFTARHSGEKNYYGFVEYLNKDSKEVREEYNIKFFVKNDSIQ